LKTDPLVSIIIVNYNGKSYLEKCLFSLNKVTYPQFEIILVDNCSSDDSIDFVKMHYPSILIIELEKNFGFAYPNNIGAKNAKGELLLFLNNDTYVEPNFLDYLVNAINTNSKVAVCQSLLLKPDKTVDSSGDFIDTMGISYSSKTKVEKNYEILSAKGACMMIKKEIFKKLNGFDEHFFITFEDVDLGWRVWILGYKVIVVSKSVVYHYGGKTIDSLRSEVMFHGYKNQIIMKLTNFELYNSLKSLTKFSLIYGLRELQIWLDFKLKGKTKIPITQYDDSLSLKPNFKAIVKTIVWLSKNQRYLWNKRSQVKSQRVLSTKDLIKKNLITNTNS
jgi:GT2 family glycosyltransferase